MVHAKTLLAVAAAFLVGCLSHGAAAAPKRQNAPSPILQKQLQEMRTAILRAWDPGGFEGTITVRVHLKRDGTVDGSPEIVSDPTDAVHYQAAATSAVRAASNASTHVFSNPLAIGSARSVIRKKPARWWIRTRIRTRRSATSRSKISSSSIIRAYAAAVCNAIS